MKTALKTNPEVMDLRYLPQFAGFVLQEHFDSYVREHLRITEEIDVPLRKLHTLPTDKIFDTAKANSAELLTLLANNQAKEHIESSLQRWISNQLPGLRKNDISGEDISLINYARKQALLKFIPFYTNDITETIELVKEIDKFMLASEMALSNVYIRLFKEDVREELYFNQKITDTSPGIIYVFDLVQRKEVYSNKKLEGLFGYSYEDSMKTDSSAFSLLIHPENTNGADQYVTALSTAAEGEVRSTEYRLKDQEDSDRWIRTYETVFKRDENGMPVQIIGIALDINAEKETARELDYREEKLLEAQELAEIGSFEWNLQTHHSKETPQLQKIFELPEGADIENLRRHIHRDDQEKVEQALRKALEQTGVYDCEFRYAINGKEKVLWSKGKVLYEDGRQVKLNGTVMDVTARHKILERLQRNEELYKQAEALAHIGHYTWHLKLDKITWTEELYRIYGFEPDGKEMTNEMVAAVNHPDDVDDIRREIRNAITNLLPFDFHYRIVRADSTQRILHARGEIVTDGDGAAELVVGTVQDVTEKQTLIRNLKRNEQLYKQAQAIAHVGNWSWDIGENHVEWTDELYRIYGLDPDIETIDYTKYLSHIHPDDLRNVKKTIQHCLETHQPYDFYHRIVTRSGTLKTIHAKGEALLDKKGVPYKLVGTAQDVTERQLLIENLQRSDALYKQAQAIAHIGTWTYFFSDHTMTWSDELFRIYGLEPQSIRITRDSFLELIHPEDRQRISEFIERAVIDTHPFELYHRNLWKDGTSRTVQVKGEVLFNDNGNIIGIFGTTQDVTKQQFIEHELRENQNFIQKIADATPSIISSYNVNTGKYRFVSKGLEQLLGYQPEAALNEGISFFINLVHPEDLPVIEARNRHAMEVANETGENENNTIIEFKYRMRHKNGKYRWFHTFGTIFDRSADGAVEHVLNISIDITERMEAEEKILEQEYFIRHIADASPTILYLFDVKNGSVLYINKEIDSVLGYVPEEIIAFGNRVVPELYHPEDATKMKDRLHEYNDPEHPKSLFQFECRMKHKTGEWRWLLVREIVFKRTVDGKISEVLGAALDITERREMEEKLFHQTIELQQSNKSLEEYAYVASHDLKEPLRKISTFGDRLLARNHEAMDLEGRTFLEKIISSSKRMQHMINDLLSVSMITGNKEFQRVSLKAILDDVIQTLDYKIEENKAVIECDHLPEANIVPSQFRQLFQNLISNSLKFVRPGTEPHVSITHKYLNPAEVKSYNLAKANKYLQIKFKDNGIGFDKQFTEKIFTIFQRLHSRSEYEGTGIGLAICRRITENHGGTITAKGEPNKGSIFTIILPI